MYLDLFRLLLFHCLISGWWASSQVLSGPVHRSDSHHDSLSWAPAARGLLQINGSTTKAQEDCIVRALRTKKLSCIPDAGQSAAAYGLANATTHDKLIRVLQECIRGNVTTTADPTKIVRVLFLKVNLSSIISNITERFSNITGVPVQIFALPGLAPARLASIANASNASYTHEAWTVPQTTLGEGFAKGWFLDMTQLVQLDRRLKWSGLLPGIVSTALTYKSRVMALPLGLQSPYLLYDREVFETYNLTLPRTWRELADFAVRQNGTAGRWAFSSTWLSCQFGPLILRWILASLIQTQGPSQGWMFDPDTMHPLLGSAAMEEALGIVKALYDASPADDATACVNNQPFFATRRSLMTFSLGNSFKYQSHTTNPGPLHGKLGFARWPGSDVVLDIPSNKLVPCDEQRCPHAVRYISRDGQAWSVNVAPSLEATAISVNGFSPPDKAFFTFQLMSYITSPEMSDLLTLQPTSEALPVRTDQLEPSRWADIGYNYDDAVEYCRETRWLASHPNVHTQARLPGATDLTALFSDGFAALTQENNTQDILSMLNSRADSIVSEFFNGNLTAAKLEYWDSINRPTASLFTSQDDNKQGSFEAASHAISAAVLVAIIVPIVVCSLVALGVVAWVCKHGRRKADGVVHNPGPAAATTLLVTDIQDSTSLWEHLEAAVVDAAVKLHNTCIRGLAAKHQGYESVWEGDSFIIAFSSPMLALQFAAAIQRDLMQLAWSPAILGSPYANEVWVAPAKPPRRSRNLSVDGGNSTKACVGSSLVPSHASGSATPPSAASWGNSLASPRQPIHELEEIMESTSSGKTEELTLALHLDESYDKSREARTPRVSRTGTHIAMNTFCANLASQWIICESDIPGSAVCVFRGLRVRVGLHCGVELADINWNVHMRRWHYSGNARVVSNAIASAGHGGYILMDNSTARLLGQDSAGVLQDLPADCNVYSMGQHMLTGVDEPADLLLVLPAALKARLAVQQNALRSVECLLPSVLSAPAPVTGVKHGGLVLVAVHISGLETLLHWNADVTRDALRSSLACLHQIARVMDCVISEEGWSLLLSTGITKPSSSATFPDSVQPSRVVLAFPCPEDAVAFSVELRRQMLQLDWSSELLTHELCEQVGKADDAVDEAQNLALNLPPCFKLDELSGWPQANVESSIKAARPDGGRPSLDAKFNPLSTFSIANGGRFDRNSGRSSNATTPNWSLQPTKATYSVLEAPFLRGLRTRIALAEAVTEVDVAVRSSGRAVYGGYAQKHLGRLLKSAKPGQIIMSNDVVCKLGHLIHA